jgi:hypothetical protein
VEDNMRNKDYKTLLDNWQELKDALDQPILDVDFVCTLHELFYKSIEVSIGDESRWGWLEWWVNENDFGQKGLVGTQSFGKDFEEKMPIKTEEDLIKVLVRMDEEDAKNG